MNAEDQYILSNMISFCDISPDLYFFCESGFLDNRKLSNLAELYSGDIYNEELNKLFINWYKNEANEYQQMLVDLYGFTQLNDQFDDLSSIVGLDIQNQLFEPEEIPPIRTIPYEGEVCIPENLDDIPIIHLNDEEYDRDLVVSIRESIISPTSVELPFYNLEDLENHPNIVYTLAVSNKMNWRNQVNNLFHRLKNNNYNNIEAKDALNWYINYKNAQELERQIIIDEISGQLDSDYFDDDNDNLSFMSKVLNIKKDKEITLAKKAIRKGLKMLSNFVSNDEFRLFSNGDGFIIEGEKFNYCFKKSHTNFIQHTLNPNGDHIPFDMIVLNKENIELCKACIYFDKTPIIDQLLAIVLHLKSGNEEEILKTANFYNRKTEFYKNEHFSKKYKKIETKNKVKITKSSDEDKYQRYIKEKVKLAIPNFLGLKVPELLIGKFRNFYFDDFLQEYRNTGEVNPVFYAALSLD